MTTATDLKADLDALTIPDEIERDWLIDSLLLPLGIESGKYLADLCEDIFVGAAENNPGELHMRPGGWRINLSASVARTVLAAVIVGGALATVGADQIPLQLLPVVLPFLVDIERVRLNRADRELLIPLQQAAFGIEGLALHPEVLYNRLDPAVRNDLNYLDFLGFLERVIELGELDNARGGDVRARLPGEPAWLRITWT